jgi:hypothetical protein
MLNSIVCHFSRVVSQPRWLLCLAGVLLGLSSGFARAETWIDATGKFRVEAKFLGLKGQDVYLKKDSDGATIKVPLSKLSAESQKLARELAGGAPAGAAADTPDAAARAIVADLESGNLRAVWDAFPASYQKDVNDLIHTFAASMDADMWKGGADIVKKVQQILEQKKKFILAYPDVAPLADQLTPHYDKIVDVLKAIVTSELSDLSKLKTLDLGKFLDGSGKKILEKIAAFAKEADPASVAKAGLPGASVLADVPNLKKMKFTTVSMDGDAAKLRIEEEGKDTREEDVVRVEGKWVPKEMADGWAAGIAAGKEQLQEMGKSLKDPEAKKGVVGIMTVVNLVLGGIQAAQTQEDFNKAIDSLKNMAEGGGPGGPGPGGPKTTPPSSADPFGAPAPKPQ